MSAGGISAPRDAAPLLRRGKTIEQIYQKKTQLEHILLRPDTYVGSTEHQLQDMWIFDETRGRMVHRKIDYVPALYKIFDEILVNAADNAMRDPKGMDLIDVCIDKEQGFVSVMNNGQGVPVQMHKEHNIFVPELIFGHLLTSDNYDDHEKKVTGGRNGYGAKLTNVFSRKFVIETVDRSSKKKYVQVFENNMTQKHPPTVTTCTGEEYTRVTFWPDFSRFGMRKLDADITGLMMKRVYDIAGSTSRRVRVRLNGQPLKVRCFEDYIGLYLNTGAVGEAPVSVVYERCSDRWEVAMAVADGTFQQVSFANSINTIKGGTHVTHVTDQLVETIQKVVKSKNRGGVDIKPAHVRNHIWVFINCLIENPAFDSQTKETLTTKQSKFGSTCELSDKMLKQVTKSGVVELILDWLKAKEKVDLGRQLRGAKCTGRVLGIPKLEDANDAGGKHSADCTLILTEGDSAKSLAVAGLSVVGRDKYGVFPLKGKVLNVRDASFKQVSGNTEIQNLLKIMGLDFKAEYNSVSKLRYGSIMLMTDQDHDGSHIKGLLINLIHVWWPSLVKMNGFLKEFITPIVKVWKDGGREGERREEKPFYTVSEYEAWRSRAPSHGWKSKYYKGLGTSTLKEAKEYFRAISQHEIKFRWSSDRDGEAIDLAFNKKRADDRKDWINAYEDGSCVDHSKSVVGYWDFIHKELVQFAKYDVSRSVPSVVDGFKPSQRKVLFCAFKKKLRTDIKVAQFVGYVSEQSAYHHGEVSLENTIVNLAQNFVGSNNVNLLYPSGQFGTRLQGGKDHAAARYIYTRLQSVTRVVFHPDDDSVLEYLDDEGHSIEPKWYCPVLPTVLVNGADGIGVGWSTFVPNYNPRDIICNIRRMLRGEQMVDMVPWYKGFIGSIVANEQEPGKFDVTGCIQKVSDTQLEISELPLKRWTQDYKEFLESLMPQTQGKRGDDADQSHIIEDFREHHTDSSVRFTLTLSREKMREVERSGLEKTFKLKMTLNTSNMVLFDPVGKIAKYASSLDILREFCNLRRAVYEKRKAYLVAKLTREREILSNKARFILMVVKGELELRKKKKADLLRELKELRFTPMSELDAILKGRDSRPSDAGVAQPASDVSGNAGVEAEAVEKTEYDYLLNMNLWSLTYERVEEIRKQRDLKAAELDVLIQTSIEQLWDRDLEALSIALDEFDAREEEEAAGVNQGKRKARGRPFAPASSREAPSSGLGSAPSSCKMDSSFLARPLQTGTQSAIGEIQKTIWRIHEPGSMGSMGSMDSSSIAADGGVEAARVRPLGQDSKAKAKARLRSGVARVPADSVDLEPQGAKDTGSALLARLLRNGREGQDAKPQPKSSMAIDLDGPEDLFASLSGSLKTTQAGGSGSLLSGRPSMDGFSGRARAAARLRKQGLVEGERNGDGGEGRGEDGRGRRAARAAKAGRGGGLPGAQQTDMVAKRSADAFDLEREELPPAPASGIGLRRFMQSSLSARPPEGSFEGGVTASITPAPLTIISDPVARFPGGGAFRNTARPGAAGLFGGQQRRVESSGGVENARVNAPVASVTDPSCFGRAALPPAKKRRRRAVTDDDDEDFVEEVL